MPIDAMDGAIAPTTDNPADFDANADDFLPRFITLQAQINQFELDMNNLVAAAYTTTSATSLAVGTGSKSFNVQAGLGFIAGQSGVMSSAADPTNRMIFTVTSYIKASGAMVVNVSTIGGSGTHADWVVGLAPTGFQAGQTPGTTTNDDAAAGNVGEYWEVPVLTGAAVALTSGTDANICSKLVSAGDWEIGGAFTINPNSATALTRMAAAVSTTSGSRGTIGTPGYFFMDGSFNQALPPSFPTGTRRFSFAAATTVYLVGNAIWTGGTGAKGFGTLYGRRAR